MELRKQALGLNPIELEGGYKMKTIPMLMIALLLFSAMPLIAAEENGEVEVVDAGVTPDSPLYGLERAMERVQLAFIRNKAERAKFKLDLAEERLAEAEEMIVENNTEAADEAQELHDELINETEEEIEELETNGDNETAGEALEEVEELQLRLLNHSTKVAFVKNRILDRLRTSGNSSSAQLEHLEAVFGKIIAKAQEMELKMEQKRGKIRARYKVLSELNESELDDREKAFLERKQEQETRKGKFKSKVKCESEDGEVECEFEAEFEEDDDEDEDELEDEDDDDEEDDDEEDDDSDEGSDDSEDSNETSNGSGNSTQSGQ